MGGERDGANKWSDLALSSDEPRHASPRWIISARRGSAHTHRTVSSLLPHFFPLLRLSQSPPQPSVCCSALASFLRSSALPHFLGRCFSSISATAQRSAAQRQRLLLLLLLLSTVSLRTSEPLAWRVGGGAKHPSSRADVSAWHDPRPKDPRRFFLLTGFLDRWCG